MEQLQGFSRVIAEYQNYKWTWVSLFPGTANTDIKNKTYELSYGPTENNMLTTECQIEYMDWVMRESWNKSKTFMNGIGNWLKIILEFEPSRKSWVNHVFFWINLHTLTKKVILTKQDILIVLLRLVVFHHGSINFGAPTLAWTKEASECHNNVSYQESSWARSLQQFWWLVWTC